jgi:Domain of unknown function (DUF4381)
VNPTGPDIRDIRPPYWIPLDWRVLALIGAGVVLLLVLLWRTWRWYRSRRRPLTLLERALQRLEATRPLMQAGDARAFAAAVSDVVRSYVEERFSVLATHLTTTEFLRACLSQVGGALQAHEQALGDFLKFCDLAKFARWPLDGAQMQDMLASARHFVETTAAAVPAATGVAPEPINVPIRQS